MSSSTPQRTSGSAAPVQLAGRMLGRYRLLAHIASGGMASVHVARAEGTLGFERLVAVKLLHPHLVSEDEFVHMIGDEARMAARVRNPKVVATLDVDYDEALGLYLVMEYIEGDHLGNLVKSLAGTGERLSPRVGVRIVLDLLEGLAAAHDLTDAYGSKTPIIHRDVSPHNVLVGVDGMARLADFGVARAESRLTQTQEGRFKGKIAYMAPEQLADGIANERSDLFAAGVVLWETLTGSRLFRGDSTAEVLKKLLHDPIPRVSSVDPELASVADVVDKALARDPNRRFASAVEMSAALAEAASSSFGIAEAVEVGRELRGARGLAIAERAMRVRTAVETLAPPSEPSFIARKTPIGGSSTNPAVPSRMVRASTPTDELTERPTRRRKRSLVALLAMASAAVLGGLAAFFVGGRAEPSARPSASAQIGAAPAVFPDAEASLIEGQAPGISAELATVTPTIVVRAKIGADGRVIEATPFQSRPDLAVLEQDAVAAVKGYRFRPAYRSGRPIESEINLPVRFQRVSGPEHVVRIKGSDTIGGTLGPALALAFRTKRPDIHVTVEALGSSTAFVGLFDGSADLGASSRAIKSTEAAEASRMGVILEETVIGYDGIAIVVHPSSPLASLTLEEVAAIFSGSVTRFEELGAGSGPIRVLGRPAYSGTHQFFLDRVLSSRQRAFSTGIEELEHSDAIIRAVAADPSAIAYVGAAYVDASVKMVPIADGATHPVAPTESTIRDGSYPIFRPLLMYSRGSPSHAAAELLRFALSPEGHRIVRSCGFVPSSATIAESSTGVAPDASPGFLRRIPFLAGTLHVGSESMPVLREVTQRLVDRPMARVIVTGHADAEGTEADNVRIGLERAHRVSTALVRLGVPASAITTESRGSTAPIATNADEAGKARNRRVDVIVVETPR